MKKVFRNICLLAISLLLATFFSCNNRVYANFQIINSSGFTIDSLSINPGISVNKKNIKLLSNEKIMYKVDMTEVPKTDGAYVISYILNGENNSQAFGYYSNGLPINNLIQIEVKKDTLEYRAKF